MKPRYYPHITVAAAVVITILPLCLVLSLPHLRDTADSSSIMAGSPDSWDAEIDSTVKPILKPSPASDVKSSVAVRTPDSVKPLPPAAPAKPPRAAPQETRLAMRTNSAAGSAGLPRPDNSAEPVLTESWPAIATPQTRPLRDATVALVDVSPDQASGATVTENVPVPADIAAAAEPRAKTSETNTIEDSAAAEKARLDSEMETALADRSTDRGPTYFDSTGHLALMTAPTPTATSSPPADRTAGQTSNSKRRRDRSGRMTDKSDLAGAMHSAASVPNHTGTWTVDDAEFGTMPPDTVEDVILQQPLETRRVNRVESVIAVTRAKGWPIAMVRSDLPDDHWWVQQMVGIRGNAFAARVNFGNDESIPGSVYHLMIVFLDSPDEVRRFRIAKQFKEVPEGVRHSRQFTFVRQ